MWTSPGPTGCHAALRFQSLARPRRGDRRGPQPGDPPDPPVLEVALGQRERIMCSATTTTRDAPHPGLHPRGRPGRAHPRAQAPAGRPRGPRVSPGHRQRVHGDGDHPGGARSPARDPRGGGRAPRGRPGHVAAGAPRRRTSSAGSRPGATAGRHPGRLDVPPAHPKGRGRVIATRSAAGQPRMIGRGATVSASDGAGDSAEGAAGAPAAKPSRFGGEGEDADGPCRACGLRALGLVGLSVAPRLPDPRPHVSDERPRRDARRLRRGRAPVRRARADRDDRDELRPVRAAARAATEPETSLVLRGKLRELDDPHASLTESPRFWNGPLAEPERAQVVRSGGAPFALAPRGVLRTRSELEAELAGWLEGSARGWRRARRPRARPCFVRSASASAGRGGTATRWLERWRDGSRWRSPRRGPCSRGGWGAWSR